MEFLTNYMFPRYIYILPINPPIEGVLKLLDSENRQEVKGTLNLMPSTAIGFFYTLKANEGLGLSRFEHIVKFGTLKSAIKMKNSLSPAAFSLIDDKTEITMKRIGNSLRINWPVTSEDIEKVRKRMRREHIKQWAELRNQGQGVPYFAREKFGNMRLKEYYLSMRTKSGLTHLAPQQL